MGQKDKSMHYGLLNCFVPRMQRKMNAYEHTLQIVFLTFSEISYLFLSE